MTERRLRDAAESMNAALAGVPVPEPPRRGRRPALVAAAAAVVVLLVVGGWALVVGEGSDRLDAAAPRAEEAVAMIEAWAAGAAARDFDAISALAEPDAMDRVALEVAGLAERFGTPAVTAEHFLTDTERAWEIVCLEVDYGERLLYGGVIVRDVPGRGLRLWEFRSNMEGCAPEGTEPRATTTVPAAVCQPTTPQPGFVPPDRFPPEPPFGEVWYGTSDLFTALPPDGARWFDLPGSADGTLAQKTFWWSDDFDAGLEPEPAITVTARRLDGEAPAVVATPGTNGSRPDTGTFMLVGIELPATGCWEITAQYRGFELSYVVEVTR